MSRNDNDCANSKGCAARRKIRNRGICPLETMELAVETARAEISKMAKSRRTVTKQTAVSLGQTEKNSVVVYVIPDAHIGMLSYRHETGVSHDIEKSKKMLLGGLKKIVEKTARTEKCVLAILGDFFHYDGIRPVTTASGHLLDADSRYGKMYREGFSCLVSMIGLCLSGHEKVCVSISKGNHDDILSFSLSIAVAAMYSADARVDVMVSENDFHFISVGKTLLGLTHGTVAKKRLPEVMQADAGELYARSKYKYWLIGHRHVRERVYLGGCTIETFSSLCPNDAWAHSKGFRSTMEFEAIRFDREDGEVERVRVPVNVPEDGARKKLNKKAL